MRRIAWVGLCLGVGLLAAVTFTAASPIGIGALLLAPVIVLALFTFGALCTVGYRSLRRWQARTAALGDAHSHTR
jgi:hypothetical protein